MRQPDPEVIERQYALARELTRQMLDAAVTQNWDTLVAAEQQRAAVIAALPQAQFSRSATDSVSAQRIASIIMEMERDNGIIVEYVETQQKHIRVLLQLDKQ